MKRPRIGITSDYETITDRRDCPSPRYVVPASYVAAVTHAGGDAVLLPHPSGCPDSRAASNYLDILDGLVVAGGDFDLPPEYFGESPHAKLGALLPERSAFEREILQGALAQRLPVLAVCGGMQLLNVLRGGTLHQDLSLRPGTHVHEQPEDKRKPFHSVDVTPDSLLARCLGTHEGISVNSTHHQIVNAVGNGLNVSATAVDGVVESIEDPDFPFVLGIQWHPEAMATEQQLGMYRALVANCR